MTPPKSRYELLRPYAGALPGPWVYRAACAGLPSGIFYPDDSTDISPSRRAPWNPNRALAICRACPVRQECAEFALTTKERDGVWGGMSEAERNKILGRRPKVH